MTHFHGSNKRRAFFEGWYVKHQAADRTLAIIPAFHVDGGGNASASIQVITDDGAHALDFPAVDFSASKERFLVRIGENLFHPGGIELKMQMEGFALQGRLDYGPFMPPKSDMMGPFRVVPFMQCHHGVLSFAHRLSGHLMLNGEPLDFTGGMGYIEKDWGISFPKAYLWTQCGWFDAGACCVMLSIADIPFLGGCFTGCICAILYAGKEYRLATYRGVRVVTYTDKEVVLEQAGYRLQVSLLRQHAHSLRAPEHGGMMSRTIHESAACTVRYRFWVNRTLLFDVTSTRAGFEYAGEK